MKILTRIVQEIRNGENIDIYVGIPLAALIAFLGISQQVSTEMVSAATLAVLAVVLGSILGSRWNTEGIKDAIDNMTSNKCSADDFFQEFSRGDLSSQIAASDSVLFWSVTFTSTIRDLRYAVEEALRNGSTIRVMLIRPNSPTSQVASLRNRQWDEKRISEVISESVRFLHDFSTSHPNSKLEVRFSDYLPPWGMIAVYPKSSPGHMMIRINALHITGDKRPAFVVDASKDPKWFKSFERQFEEAWKLADTEV